MTREHHPRHRKVKSHPLKRKGGPLFDSLHLNAQVRIELSRHFSIARYSQITFQSRVIIEDFRLWRLDINILHSIFLNYSCRLVIELRAFRREGGTNTICVAQILLFRQGKLLKEGINLGLHFAFLQHVSKEIVFTKQAIGFTMLVLDRHVQLRLKLVETLLAEQFLFG